MADLSNYGENLCAEALTDSPYIKLHKGAPGEEGTANAATTTTRDQVTLGAASGGARVSTTDAEFTMAASETITHVSAWDHATAGNCEWVATLAEAKALTSGDTLQFEAGDLSIALA
jgi:hypothetical protein